MGNWGGGLQRGDKPNVILGMLCLPLPNTDCLFLSTIHTSTMCKGECVRGGWVA